MAPRKKTLANPASVEQPKVEQETKVEQTASLDIEALLNFDVERIFQNLSELGPNAVPAIKEVYEAFVGDLRPVLKMTPQLVAMVGKDIAPLAAAFLVTLNEIVIAEEMQAAFAAARKTRAISRRQALEAYVAEGFTREEALTLVLQDVAVANQKLSTASNNFKASRTSA